MEKMRSLCPVGVMYLLSILPHRFVSLWLSKPISLINCPLPNSYRVHLQPLKSPSEGLAESPLCCQAAVARNGR